jgi:putative flippase GtrA
MTTSQRPRAILIQVQRFSLVGVLNTLVDFLVYALLVQVGLYYLASQAAAYACGLACSFLLNRSWTFGYRRLKDRLLLPRFLAVNLCAWGVLELALFLLVGQARLPALLGKVLATPFSLTVNFLGNRLWVFRAQTPALPTPATRPPETTDRRGK